MLALNRQFYQTFALQFSATRQRLQPGVMRLLPSINSTAALLDLGCGNGELARALARRGHHGFYVGLDSSPELLSVAHQGIKRDEFPSCRFFQADLSSPDWDRALLDFVRNRKEPGQNVPFDFILAFAVLHHLPGEMLRKQVLEKSRTLLAPGGRFIHSEWQFLENPRLRTRIQPWGSLGLVAEQVDLGDYLLDWRQGGCGLRYVHLFTLEELAELAQATGFEVVESFSSDGEGGKLGLYQVWKPA